MKIDITLFLTLAQQGDHGAEEEVIRLVYDKLRKIARIMCNRERLNHTLQPTALVNEAFVQKLRLLSLPIRNRDHYYALAATAMRQVLVDHARRNRAKRRRISPEIVAETLLRSTGSASDPDERISVNNALRGLAECDAAAAKCVECRFVEGFTVRETALHLNIPEWRVRDDCEFALTWLASELGGSR